MTGHFQKFQLTYLTKAYKSIDAKADVPLASVLMKCWQSIGVKINLHTNWINRNWSIALPYSKKDLEMLSSQRLGGMEEVTQYKPIEGLQGPCKSPDLDLEHRKWVHYLHFIPGISVSWAHSLPRNSREISGIYHQLVSLFIGSLELNGFYYHVHYFHAGGLIVSYYVRDIQLRQIWSPEILFINFGWMKLHSMKLTKIEPLHARSLVLRTLISPGNIHIGIIKQSLEISKFFFGDWEPATSVNIHVR